MLIEGVVSRSVPLFDCAFNVTLNRIPLLLIIQLPENPLKVCLIVLWLLFSLHKLGRNLHRQAVHLESLHDTSLVIAHSPELSIG